MTFKRTLRDDVVKLTGQNLWPSRGWRVLRVNNTERDINFLVSIMKVTRPGAVSVPMYFLGCQSLLSAPGPGCVRHDRVHVSSNTLYTRLAALD